MDSIVHGVAKSRTNYMIFPIHYVRLISSSKCWSLPKSSFAPPNYPIYTSDTIQLKLLAYFSKSTPFPLKYTLSSCNGIHWSSRNLEVIPYSTWSFPPFSHSQLIFKSCQFYILSRSPIFQALYSLSYYFTWRGPTSSFTWSSVNSLAGGSPPHISTFSNLLFTLPPESFSFSLTKLFTALYCTQNLIQPSQNT